MKIENLEKTIKEQQNNYGLLRSEFEKLVKRSAPPNGPKVFVGNINVALHEKKMRQGTRGVVDKYFWPKKWFPQFQQEIELETTKTQ